MPLNWSNFVQWWKAPFNANASATTWFLFTGLVLVSIYLWTRILREGGNVIEDI